MVRCGGRGGIGAVATGGHASGSTLNARTGWGGSVSLSGSQIHSLRRPAPNAPAGEQREPLLAVLDRAHAELLGKTFAGSRRRRPARSRRRSGRRPRCRASRAARAPRVARLERVEAGHRDHDGVPRPASPRRTIRPLAVRGVDRAPRHRRRRPRMGAAPDRDSPPRRQSGSAAATAGAVPRQLQHRGIGDAASAGQRRPRGRRRPARASVGGRSIRFTSRYSPYFSLLARCEG